MFAQFLARLVRVRDDGTGERRPPVLHPEEVRLVAAMDARRRRCPPVSPRRDFAAAQAGKVYVGCIAVYMPAFHALRRTVKWWLRRRRRTRAGAPCSPRSAVKSNPWLASRITLL